MPISGVLLMHTFARGLGQATMRSTPRYRSLLAAAITAATFAGCSSDVVFRDRAPFNPPPDAVSGFLGYYDASAKQTTCGNCHAGYQAGWITTAHASAHSELSAADAANPQCTTCHTVTGRGNVASGTTAGHDAVPHEAYFDVQCESCHGPGLQHVESVGQGSVVRPLAKIGLTGIGNCGDCHSGGHHPLVDEWKLSRHANLNTSRASNPGCVGCHEARGALAKWGEDADFIEKLTSTDYQPPATCATCHDPHGSGNTAQLRFSISSTDPEQNLCIRCHLNRAEPNVSSHGTSPHAPQGGVLLGFAGWRPPGFQYDTAAIFGTHATERNPRLCAGCHVAKFTATDQLTGAFTFEATSHLMRPIPCLDSEGLPTADKTCAYTTSARSWQTCASSQCHGSAQAAANAFNDSRALMKSFTDQLWSDLNGNGAIDPAPTDGGMLATLKGTRPEEWDTPTEVTPAEGAEFNARLCGEYGQSNSDNSKGVHNPFLCRALLIATINYVSDYYSLSSSASVQAQITKLTDGDYFRSMHISRTSLGR
jgi:predicted CXXCH cytochrome family protein